MSEPASDRIHQIKCPLPPGAGGECPLIFRQLKGKEQLGQPFRFDVDLVSEQPDIDPNKLLGELMTVSVKVPDRSPRCFNGYVTRFDYIGRAEGNSYYRATLRPWIWVLSRNADCRIFQEMTVIDIFEKVCRDTHGFSDFRLSLSEQYRTREYCVQYRESDLAFVNRLLEEEGIYYYFEHKEDKHTLVLADSNSAFPDVEGETEIPYRAAGEARVDQEHISDWAVGHKVRTGAYVVDDYDFTKPRVDLEGGVSKTRSHGNADYERYDYPGLHWEAADGEQIARIRLEELQTEHKQFDGVGDHRGLAAGRAFKLKDYPVSYPGKSSEYVVISAEYSIESAEIDQPRESPENRFDVDFKAIARDEPFRPARVTPKPFVHGPQTAVVTGKQGEEIWTDQYARVKVQFHWDREGQMDENSSCWIRVSQLWAGKTWGGIHIPRIGQEVVVDFLEGDPDRPLITGRVYNDNQMPPYALPDNQTQSGIQSRSTKDGTPENFNELRFEDKAGEEHIYFHAEKDFERVVENNDVLRVGVDKQDPGDQTIEIHGNRGATILTGNDATTVDQGNHSTTVSQGNHSIGVTAGKSTVTAAQKITLTVGGSSITIEPAKITLSSPEIAIAGTAKVSVSGAMTQVNGSATLMLGGGVVKIN